MPYTVLSANDLLDRLTHVIQKYTDKLAADNATPCLDEVCLLLKLESIAASLKTLDRNQCQLTDDEYKELCVAMWVYFLSAHSLKKGWNHAKQLNDVLATEPEIQALSGVDPFLKLTALKTLHHVVKQHGEQFSKNFTYLLNTPDLCKDLLDVMSFQLKAVTPKTQLMLNAIPSQNVLKMDMRTVYQKYKKYLDKTAAAEYIHSSHDPCHKALALLISAMGYLPDDANDKYSNSAFLTRSERIYWGIILYAMQFIYNKYYVLSADRAKLYRLCRKLLNGNDLKYFDEQTRLACLAAFFNWFDGNHLEELEGIVNKEILTEPTYTDYIFFQIKDHVAEMIRTMGYPKPAVTGSAVTLGCAMIGGILAAAPGYGVGYTIGFFASELRNTVDTKVLVSQLTGRAITGIFGSGRCIGYFVSDMVINVALERSFAKIFELLAILLGAGTGALFGIVIHDLSYKTLRDLCHCCLMLQSKLHPNLARNIEPHVLDCLLSLPEEVFQQEQKDKLRAITRQGIFQEKRLSQETTASLIATPAILLETDDDEGLSISGTDHHLNASANLTV